MLAPAPAISAGRSVNRSTPAPATSHGGGTACSAGPPAIRLQRLDVAGTDPHEPEPIPRRAGAGGLARGPGPRGARSVRGGPTRGPTTSFGRGRVPSRGSTRLAGRPPLSAEESGTARWGWVGDRATHTTGGGRGPAPRYSSLAVPAMPATRGARMS